MSRLVLPFFAVLLVLLILARLATRLLPLDIRELQQDGARRLIWWLGLLLLVASALAVTVLAAGIAPGRPLLVWVEAGVVAGVGIGLVAVAAGMRLSLQVEASNATGQPDPAAVGYIVARLRALGTAPLRGLEVPMQTDVTQLPSDALTTLPEGRVAAALFRLLRVVLPTVPWHANVAVMDSARAAVRVTRNGRAAKAVIISRPALGLSPAPGDGQQSEDASRARAELLTGAAAFILVTLSEGHPQLKEGLCKATQWNSLTLQVLATEKPLADDEARARAALARAVDVDPSNHSARIAYLHHFGRQGSPDDRKRFAESMDEEYILAFPDGRVASGFEALQLRILFSRAAGWLNIHLLERDETAWRKALDAARQLITYLEERIRLDRPEDRWLKEFAASMQPAARYLWNGVVATTPSNIAERPNPIIDQTPEPLSLHARYERACWQAEAQDGNTEAALRDLELSVGLEELRTSARQDPSFALLRDDKRFKTLLYEPAPSDFLALAPFATHRDELAALGIAEPEQLHEHTASTLRRWRLARHLRVDAMVVEHWHGVAALAMLDQDLRSVPLLDLLLTVQVDSPAALHAAADDERIEQFIERLHKEARDRVVVAPTRQSVEKWVRAA